MDWTGCDVVAVNPARSAGRPLVRDSRVRADTVVESWELGESIDDIEEAYSLTPADIRKLLVFAGAHASLQRSPPTDWTGCDVVEVVPGKVSGKPIVKHSRVMADQLVESFELGESVDDIAYSYSLHPAQVRAVLTFAGLHTALEVSAENLVRSQCTAQAKAIPSASRDPDRQRDELG